MSNLIFKQGNLLDSSYEALVCPVNCESVMGAGVAKLFRDKKEFTDQNEVYKKACNSGELSPGSVLTVFPRDKGDKVIIYMATKNDWRNDSKLEWIETGLFNLYKAIYFYNIGSVAMPAVGCGKGLVPWPSVEMYIKAIFALKDKQMEVYLPHENL